MLYEPYQFLEQQQMGLTSGPYHIKVQILLEYISVYKSEEGFRVNRNLEGLITYVANV